MPDSSIIIIASPCGVEGAKYLVSKGVVAIGADTWGLEVIPFESPTDGKNAVLTGTVDTCIHGIAAFILGAAAGEPVVVMGPTGTPTEIPEGETVLLAGGGLGNAVLFSIAQAMKAAGSNSTTAMRLVPSTKRLRRWMTPRTSLSGLD
jgi:hypothetical protein